MVSSSVSDCSNQNYQAELSLVKIFAEGQHFSRIIIRQNTGKLKECKIIWSQFMANVWPIYSQTHLKGFHGKLWSKKQKQFDTIRLKLSEISLHIWNIWDIHELRIMSEIVSSHLCKHLYQEQSSSGAN